MSSSLKVALLAIELACLIAIAYRVIRTNAGRTKLLPSEGIVSELARLPQGIRVIHSPARVLGPHEGPNSNDWTYRWFFRTEVRPIGENVTILQFGILAWDGSNWILDEEQKLGNSGLLEQATFVDWYGLSSPTLTPETPAVDESNWAGSRQKAPFRQLWFFIGENSKGERLKGEGIVEFATETSLEEQ